GGVVNCWEVASGKIRLSLKGHEGAIWKARFTHAGRILVTGSADGTVRQWDVRTGKTITAIHVQAGRVHDISLARDGALLAAAGNGGVRLRDGATGKDVFPIKQEEVTIWSIAFTPDGRTLATGDARGTIKLWSVARLFGRK